MATHEATIHPFPAQDRTPLAITSEAFLSTAKGACTAKLDGKDLFP